MLDLRKYIETRGWTQCQAAAFFGESQSLISNLMQGGLVILVRILADRSDLHKSSTILNGREFDGRDGARIGAGVGLLGAASGAGWGWGGVWLARPSAGVGPRRESVARLGLDGGRQFEGGISQSGCPDRDFCCFVAVLVAYASAAKIQKSEPGDC